MTANVSYMNHKENNNNKKTEIIILIHMWIMSQKFLCVFCIVMLRVKRRPSGT